MIYTLTINPSIDYIVGINDFSCGKVNRTSTERIQAGGKGINVSLVLNNLGIKNIALGFTAGFTGKEISNLLSEKKLRTDFIHLPNGMSRINMKIHSNDETEINGSGPEIDNKYVNLLFEKLDSLVEGDTLVLAGSIPSTLKQTLYSDIMKKLSNKKINFVVDATNKLLINTLELNPFLIKPNNHELSEIFGVEINDRKSAIPWAKKLLKMGAQNVLVSLAEKGAILCNSCGEVFESDAPKGVVVNSVGAGDSMVAGFLAEWINSKNYEKSLKNGILAGSASTFTGELATPESMDHLIDSWKS